MKRLNKISCMLCAAALTLAAPARAQIISMHQLADGVQGAAYVDSIYIHTDNLFYQSSNGVSSGGYQIKPYVQVNLDGPAVNVRLRTSADYAHYTFPSAFESTFLDSMAAGSLEWLAGTRSRFNFDAQYTRSHDPIGTFGQEALPIVKTEADKWTEAYFDGNYRFGAEDAAVNVEVGGSHRTRDYISNEAATQFLNRHSDGADAVLYFNYSPKTSFLVDVQQKWTRFDNVDASGTSHDADETLYRAGVQWKATAKTSGDIRVGYSTRDIKAQPTAHPLSTWAGSLVWTPGVRTAFSFGARRALEASYVSGASYIDSREVESQWSQQWGSRLSTWVNARLVASGFAGTSRNDDVRKIGLKMEYSLVRYASVIGSVDRTVRNSTSAPANFTVDFAYVGMRFVP